MAGLGGAVDSVRMATQARVMAKAKACLPAKAKAISPPSGEPGNPAHPGAREKVGQQTLLKLRRIKCSLLRLMVRSEPKC